MFDTKIKNLLQIEWVRPRAFLTSRLSPVKIIAELSNGQYTYLLPPFYEIEEIVPKYDFESAVSKYDYQLVKGKHVLYNRTDLRTFLKWFRKQG